MNLDSIGDPFAIHISMIEQDVRVCFPPHPPSQIYQFIHSPLDSILRLYFPCLEVKEILIRQGSHHIRFSIGFLSEINRILRVYWVDIQRKTNTIDY